MNGTCLVFGGVRGGRIVTFHHSTFELTDNATSNFLYTGNIPLDPIPRPKTTVYKIERLRTAPPYRDLTLFVGVAEGVELPSDLRAIFWKCFLNGAYKEN